MTGALRMLTPRGRTLAVLGIAGIGIGWALRQPAIVAVAILLLLVPLLGLLTVGRSRFLLGTARSVTSHELPFGAEGEVVLAIENGSRLSSNALLIEDAVPESLGSPARILLDQVRPSSRRTVRYSIHGRRRGRARIGPVSVTVIDPFGTALRTQSFTATTSVLVTPATVDLSTSTATPVPEDRGQARARTIAARGEDDILPREHRPGDEMRRIHWRATARSGSLMVRREELSRSSCLTVLLDDRAGAYPTSTTAVADVNMAFEWAVSAAASIALLHLRHGWKVAAVTTSGRMLAQASPRSPGGRQSLVQAFADITLANAQAVEHTGVDGVGSTAVVAVMGLLGDDGVRALARPLAVPSGCLLLEPGPVGMMQTLGWHACGWTLSTDIVQAWPAICPTSARDDQRGPAVALP